MFYIDAILPSLCKILLTLRSLKCFSALDDGSELYWPCQRPTCKIPASHRGALGSFSGGQSGTRAGFYPSLLQFSPANYYSAMAACYHRTLKCGTALIRQHIITSSVFKLGASSLSQHLIGYRSLS
jgi:hypothetical protein